MKLSDEELRAVWRQRATDVTSDRSACLTEVEFARLLSKEAEGAERLRAAAHIASCAECADEYRLLQPLQEWSGEVERALAPPAATLSRRWSAWLSSLSSPLPAFATAAALVLLVTQGVGVYLLVGSRRETARLETQLTENQRALSSTQTSLTALEEQLRSRRGTEEDLNALRQRLAQQSTPQLDAVIAELDPLAGGAVRGASDTQILTTPPGGSSVTLILNFEPLGARATLEVEVADEGGQVRWMGRTERDRAAATVILSLPAGGYPPGRYMIRLSDVTHGRRLLATYSMVLRQGATPNR